MKNLLNQNLSRVWSSLIINEILENKIFQFYLSPGMRNAPLIAALEHYKNYFPETEIHVCMDERAASYRALGYSKATGKASVLVCTSGTAMANYYPAVIEAKKSNIPLIIISADRPSELTHCDDNQTIDQTKFYGDFIQGELNLGAPSLDISPLALTSSLSNLIHKAFYPQMGPVHFNSPFREPLENTSTNLPENYLKLAEIQIRKAGPSTEYLELDTRLAEKSLKRLAETLNHTKKGLLVIGSLNNNENRELIEQLIERLKWPVYFDVSSGLKYQYNLLDNTLPTFDHPEVQEHFLKNPPDTIFHIGGRLTSKHYYSYLKQVPTINLITLSKNIEKEDPSHHTKLRINADITATLNDLNPLITFRNEKIGHDLNFEIFAQKKIDLIDNGVLAFPKISKKVIDTIPNYSVLYLGNSTTVRTFDSYFSFETKKKLSVATNRGVSGIEGFLASGSGFVDGTNKEVYLIIGDVSFIHDLNSIYFLKSLKAPLKIIVINNYSGGIFTLMPIDKEKDVIKYVSSPHDISFEKVANLIEAPYLKITAANELEEQLKKLYALNTSAILEIFVDNELNKSMYDQLKTIKL